MKVGGRLPARDEPDDRLVLGVRLGDDRRVDARAAGGAPAWAILRLHVLEGGVDVAAESSNSMVMLAEPWREVDEICFTPSTEVTASSMMSTTSVSMTSGDAPS